MTHTDGRSLPPVPDPLPHRPPCWPSLSETLLAKPGQPGTQNDQGTTTHRPTQTVVTLLTIAVVFTIMLDETAKILLAEEDGLSHMMADVPDGRNKTCGNGKCGGLLVIFSKLIFEAQGDKAALCIIRVGVAAMLGLQATS